MKNKQKTKLKMGIVVKRLNSELIEIKDSAGIRLMLLNPKDNLGLHTYFEIRISHKK
jgi:hypothetical protein